jgi:hypothetical protein
MRSSRGSSAGNEGRPRNASASWRKRK